MIINSIGNKKGRISATFKAWCGAGSNRRHKDFQSFALPTELPHRLYPIFDWGGKNMHSGQISEILHRKSQKTLTTKGLTSRNRAGKPSIKWVGAAVCTAGHTFPYIPYSLKNLIRMIFSCSQVKSPSDNSC